MRGWRQRLVLPLILVMSLLTGVAIDAKFGSNKRLPTKKSAAMITSRGAILLNHKAQKYFKGYDYVVADYDYGQERLSLKPVKEPSENSMRIYRARKGKVVVIVEKNFLKNAGASMTSKKYFQCVWDSEQKSLLIDYKNPVTRKSLEKE